MALNIDKMKANPNFRVHISGGTNGAISGYITDDFSFSASSSYNAANSSSGDAINNFSNDIISLMNRSGADFSSQQMKSIAGTMLLWQGTDNLTFSIPLVFVATKTGDDVRDNISWLLDATFPSVKEGASMNWAAKVTPPFGYTKGKAEFPKGGVSVHIGTWFATTQVFVVTGVDFTFSKEVVPSGNPLYATASVSLECCRMLQATEIKKFFVGLY